MTRSERIIFMVSIHVYRWNSSLGWESECPKQANPKQNSRFTHSISFVQRMSIAKVCMRWRLGHGRCCPLIGPSLLLAGKDSISAAKPACPVDTRCADFFIRRQTGSHVASKMCPNRSLVKEPILIWQKRTCTVRCKEDCPGDRSTRNA